MTLDQVAAGLLATGVATRVRQALSERCAGQKVWIVGGAVRDAALGRDVGDIDLAVAGDPEPVARAIAAGLGGYAFELSEEFPTWRAGDREGSWQVDVATLRGPDIEGDLRLRDFTVGD